MKKLIAILVLLVCALTAVSCADEPDEPKNPGEGSTAEHVHAYSAQWQRDDGYHWRACTEKGCENVAAKAEHEWGEPVITEAQLGIEGSRVYTCKVCAQTKSEIIPALSHTCEFSEDWTSDGESHWHACTDPGCAERAAVAVHEWDEGTVISEPLSGVEGKKRFVCTVCQQTKIEAIAALPEKISEELWRDYFIFDNVEVLCSSAMGNIVISEVALIDGEYTLETMDEESFVGLTADFVAEIDFSDSYDAFEHIGDGVYFAKSLEVTADGITAALSEVKVYLGEERIIKVTYGMDVFGMVCEMSYEFSKWGEVSFELPSFDMSQLDSALLSENFLNYTLDYYCYNELDDSLSVSGMICFDGDEYVEYTYDAEYNEITTPGSLENAGIAMNAALSMICELSSEDFEYDMSVEGLALKTDGLAELGVDFLFVYIEDGYICCVEWGIEGEYYNSYGFYDYGITELEAE